MSGNEEGGGPLGLFEAFGVEIETMLVDATTLSVRPECDQLMARVGGAADSDVELGDITWCNELTLHVLEFKTSEPAPSLGGLARKFHESIRRANLELGELGARLMPGAVHPWMDPHRETVLWPHEYTDVYHAFDRIFGCSGHGWANLQSTHLNLPFQDDAEFARLHAAVRLVLPLLPAISASSPYLDGARAPVLDARLVAYRGNARRVPSVTGLVVPEPAFTREQYEREILGRIYADMASLDPEGVLRHEWANARGAIARFDRGTVEVRVMDAQECPSADLAVVAAVTEVVRALAVGPLSERDLARDPSTEALAGLLEVTIADGERAPVTVPGLLPALGLGSSAHSAGEVWRSLLDRFPPPDPDGEWTVPLEIILGKGPLARRLVAALGGAPGRAEMAEVFGRLCACLEENRAFDGT